MGLPRGIVHRRQRELAKRMQHDDHDEQEPDDDGPGDYLEHLSDRLLATWHGEPLSEEVTFQDPDDGTA